MEYLNGAKNDDVIIIPSCNNPDVKELGDKIGTSPDHVSERLKLLTLPEDVQTVTNKLGDASPMSTMSGLNSNHARALTSPLASFDANGEQVKLPSC